MEAMPETIYTSYKESEKHDPKNDRVRNVVPFGYLPESSIIPRNRWWWLGWR